MAISQKELLYYANRDIIVESFEHFSKRASGAIARKAFLCHSHFDDKLAKGVQKLLKDQGVDVYIDWQDTTLPKEINIETAKKLKERIKNSHVFLFLATQNSIASRWCPWEIGFADGINKKIFIIPTQSDNGDSHGNEYLQLYQRIDNGFNDFKTGYAIFQPNATENGQWITTEAF